MGRKKKPKIQWYQEDDLKALPIAVSVLMIGANLAVISGGTKTSVPTQSYIDFGKSFTANYLKTNGTKKYSQVKKEVDRSDWTWADYAWAEVEG